MLSCWGLLQQANAEALSEFVKGNSTVAGQQIQGEEAGAGECYTLRGFEF